MRQRIEQLVRARHRQVADARHHIARRKRRRWLGRSASTPVISTPCLIGSRNVCRDLGREVALLDAEEAASRALP